MRVRLTLPTGRLAEFTGWLTVYVCVIALPHVLPAEWVPVAVIDRDMVSPEKNPQEAAFVDHLQDNHTDNGVNDVKTIRRITGNSFSSKDASSPASSSEYSNVGSTEDVTSDGMVKRTDDGGGLTLQDLREAHKVLLKQSKAPVSGKLDFLRRLKNRLLRNIAALIPLTARSLFGSESTESEGRGHKGVGFPSNEGTLLSLCFLVFAVFLVKVVMQLIYAVQNSQANAAGTAGVRVAQMPDGMLPGTMGTMMNMVPAMMPMPPMMAAPDPAAARTRREAGVDTYPHIELAAQRVLKAIHKAQSKFA